jgi:hypothetical protein
MKQVVVYHTSVVNQIKVDGESKVITSKLISFNSLINSPVDKPDALTTTIKFTGNQVEETQYYNLDNSCLGLTWNKAVWNRTF